MSASEVVAVQTAIASAISNVEASQQAYDAAGNVRDLHEAFRKVSDTVPLVLDILRGDKKVQTQAITVYKNSNDPATKRALEDFAKAARPLATACQENAQRLRGMLRQVISGDEETRKERYWRAVRTAKPGEGRRVEELMREILETLQILHTDRFFNDAARVMDLDFAIKELSYVSPSVPDEEGRYCHFGSGPMGLNLGTGTQRNFTQSGGSGTMYNAETQHFGALEP